MAKQVREEITKAAQLLVVGYFKAERAYLGVIFI